MTDEKIREAAEKYEQAQLAALPTPPECDHIFTPRFERKMRHLLWQTNHPTLHLTMKRVACAAIVFILACGLLFTFSSDVRAAVMKWFKIKNDDYMHYSYVGDDEETSPAKYYLSQIPDGYTLVENLSRSIGDVSIYADENGRYLIFYYYYGLRGTEINSGGGEYESHTVQIENITADVYLACDSANSSAIVWFNEDNTILFQISGYLDEETLIDLVKKVSEK